MLTAECRKEYAAALRGAGYSPSHAAAIIQEADRKVNRIEAINGLEAILGQRGLPNAARRERSIEQAIHAGFGITEEQYAKYYPAGV